MSITVERIRAFNRGWTEVLGLLDQGLLETRHTLAEARVIFELAQRDRWDRLALKDQLGIDPSFLTRVLGRLESAGLVASMPSATDGRALVLGLTEQGREAFAVLDGRSRTQVQGLVEPLSEDQRATLVEAMTVIESLIRPGSRQRDIELRSLLPGDLGWVVQRHGALYWDEYGWNVDFEVLVAQVVADYQQHASPGRTNAWIAEVDGARAGCVFCCQRDEVTAQLRLLLVEPWARGHGLGADLVNECITFARNAGYSTLVLWTNSVLVSARRIYEAAGFQLLDQDEHRSFGKDLVGQTWKLQL